MFDLLYFHWTHPFLMHLQGIDLLSIPFAFLGYIIA